MMVSYLKKLMKIKREEKKNPVSRFGNNPIYPNLSKDF
jgi:hypothetical protein